ncbi:MAG: alkaline phosphatase family protein [Kiritimatiellia bacterium]
MKSVAPTVSVVLGLDRPAAAADDPIAPIAVNLAGSRHLAILAPDALGLHPWRLWKHKMPFLFSLHKKKSILLEAIMPSNTPVNFACMLTGAELAVHGMQTREMDFKCETIFDVVRRAGGKSAGAGQKGKTAGLLLGRCADFAWISTDDWHPAAISCLVLEGFEREVPMFMIVQYASVDSFFHKYGPSNPAVVPILEEMDLSLQELVPRLSGAGVDVIILADHGQHDIPDPVPGGNRGTHSTDCPEDRLVPCTWVKRR